MSDLSARDRFVEAMRGIMGATHSRVPPAKNHGCMICRDASQAVEAFARRVMEVEHRAGAHDTMPCLEACYEAERDGLLARCGL